MTTGEVKVAGGAFDRKILKLAATGMSPEAISKQIGGVLTPAKVAIHIHKLLENPDSYLTIPQQIKLELNAMRETLAELRDRVLDDDNAKIRLAYTQTILKTLESLQKQNTQDLETYNAAVGRAMVAAYDIALAHIGGVLRDKVTPEEWHALKREALEVAQAEVIKRQVEA